jgi:hypothetical protein
LWRNGPPLIISIRVNPAAPKARGRKLLLRCGVGYVSLFGLQPAIEVIVGELVMGDQFATEPFNEHPRTLPAVDA